METAPIKITSAIGPDLVAALFTESHSAHGAIADLESAGFRRDRVAIAFSPEGKKAEESSHKGHWGEPTPPESEYSLAWRFRHWIEHDLHRQGAEQMSARHTSGAQHGEEEYSEVDLHISSKEKLSAEQMQGKLNQLFKIQQPGGFENFGQALQQYGKIQPLIQSGVLSEEHGMGLLSAMSTASPEEASTMVDQFVRMTMQGRMRMRGMKVPEGTQYETTAAYMKDIGADKLSDPIAIGKKIAADLKEQESKATKKGEKFDVYGYLLQHGFNTDQERQMAMLFGGLENKGRMQPLEEAMNAKPEVGAPGQGVIDKRFEDRRKNDIYYQNRTAEKVGELADVQRGIENEPMVVAQKSAFNRLKAQGKISGSFEEWKNRGFWASGTDNVFFGGYHRQVNTETDRMLRSERERLGLPMLGEWQWDEHETRRRSAQEVKAAGGDLTGTTAEALDKAAKNIEAATDGLLNVVRPAATTPAPRVLMPMPNTRMEGH